MRLAVARQRCSDLLSGSGTLAQLDDGAPALVDSRYAPELASVISRFGDGELSRYPGLAFAAGRLATLELNDARAERFLAAATAPGRADIALVARAFWELGCLHLRHQRLEAAEVTLALARGALGGAADVAADVLHLKALIAERRGQVETARRGYRDAIASAGALSQLTRVTALRNLAASLTHSQPHESVALCEFALALVEADLLDERARPTINNVHAYALLCSGDLEGGAARAAMAYAEATHSGHELIAQYGRFNQAVAHELKGDAPAALSMLQDLLVRTERDGELYGWIQLRKGWLATKAGDLAVANALLAEVRGDGHGHVYDQASATLRALIAFQGREMASAATAFASLAEDYSAQGDPLTTFVLLLWCARATSELGHASASEVALRRAGALASAHGFRISPNWWAADLAEFALASKGGQTDELFKGLLIAAGTLQAPPDLDVRVASDGSIAVRGRRVNTDQWRVGKTGSGVLQKAFRLFATAQSTGLSRDELTDVLWPDSDGDRALANLYACLNDLRHFLARIPGLRLDYDGGRYRLVAERFVTFETSAPPRSTQH
jgi:hypothetical protein